MAEKKIVVTENQEVAAQEVIPVEPQQKPAEPVVDAPKTSDEPKTDKQPSEPAPKVETPVKQKKQKKASEPKAKKEKPVVPVKEKSEKPVDEESAPKQLSKKDKLIVVKKDKAEEKRRAAIAAEVKKLQAAGLAKEDIEMFIAAKFPPINKVEPKKDEPKVSARDAMFPASFEVSGIKFTRLDLEKGTVYNHVTKKDIESYIPSLFEAKNSESDMCQICLAIQWSEEMLAPKGAKGNGKSLYEQSIGIVPPRKFPHDLDILLVDAILNVRVEKIMAHSLYTECPGTVEFACFNKRTKDGWFDVNNAPCEVYLADFSGFDFKKNGAFVDLYSKATKKNDK